jgi:protein-S-isoprenylcysteine O-methyltransferase Ste14
MKSYFDTSHAAGLVFLIVILSWGAMELAEYSQGQEARKGATRIGRRGSWIVAVMACVIGANVALYLGPHFVPAAAIRPAAAAFAVGLAILLAGLVLRGWSFKALGQYFTFTVMVSSDQPVVTVGPYRVLRHPSYTGVLLACAGVGLAAANWIAFAGLTLLPLILILWRIHIEESALLGTLGDRYRTYAAEHKRLVPLIW